MLDEIRDRCEALDGVVRICRWEHYLVTHCGYTLEPRGDGTYDLVPPDDRGPP